MDHINGKLNRKLKMALIGGGQGSFIGRVHNVAAILDNRAELVAGALSSTPEKSKASAPFYDIRPERAYGSFEELLDEELKLPEGDRIDFITIATPNHTHFPIARAAVERGINVCCDKPMTFNLGEAEELIKLVEKSGVVFAVTHNYTGYPLVRQAREMIRNGELGEIQAVRSKYLQGWLRTQLEKEGSKQAEWRVDPKKSGAAGAFGDIGTHSYNLIRYVTGLIPDQVSCNLKVFEPGRRLDDYGHAVIRFGNGGLGTVTASQISHGHENDLSIEVDGTKGSLSWRQEEPNALIVRRNGEPTRIYTRDPNAPYLHDLAKASCRLPGGHPEAFFEAFANVYRFAYDDMIKRASGEKFDYAGSVYPNVYDGIDGMFFIQQCVASSQDGGAWLTLKHPAQRH
ncbi:Gfo/Idh/MocA family protein [Planctomicrobium sp. SH664]|uniref:Gfo/Idh/MocA family protein n=1 Tax=Planctomicrobium sp. SH664 TaxID=3448125 RepID=UPI003F5BAFBD